MAFVDSSAPRRRPRGSVTQSELSVPPAPERRPPGRLARMPRVVTGLVGAVVIAHAARYLLSPAALDALINVGAVVPARGLTLASALGHVFLHAGWLHLAFNMFLILQTGELVAERFGRGWGGAARFLALFFASGAAGALTYIALNPGSQAPAIGASGAACGLFSAYLMALAPDWRAALRSPQILQMGFYFLAVNVGVAMLARSSGVLPIAWEAHLGGFIAGLALYPVLAPKRRALRSPWD